MPNKETYQRLESQAKEDFEFFKYWVDRINAEKVTIERSVEDMTKMYVDYHKLEKAKKESIEKFGSVNKYRAVLHMITQWTPSCDEMMELIK